MRAQTVQRERETFRNERVAIDWLADRVRSWLDQGYSITTAIIIRTSSFRPEWSVSIEVAR